MRCRSCGTKHVARIAVAVLVLGAIEAAPAGALPAPRLRALLKSAPLVVAGEATAVRLYGDDRVAVIDLAADRIFKGRLPGAPPFRVALVELHEGPNRPRLTAGTRGIAFLRPAGRTSYLAKVLPDGTYYEVLPDYGSFVAAASAADADRQAAVVERLIAAASGQVMNARTARQLTFDLLASASPLLVEDAAAGLADLGPQPELDAAETDTLRGALLRADLPNRVRIALIEAVGQAGITGAVPALQQIEAPPAVAEVAWQALDRLGAPPPEKKIDERLASRDPQVRAAAARELLRRDGSAAVPRVALLAIQDPDPATRKAAIEALGALGKPEALPPLERVFADSSTDLQQAAARAILAVGGQPAVDALGRLAFTGTPSSQRYAVLVLMLMPDAPKENALKRIADTHPDEQVRDLIAHGIPQHHH